MRAKAFPQALNTHAHILVYFRQSLFPGVFQDGLLTQGDFVHKEIVK
jgi:hypothetical protein